ncbi:SURF1 family protein [Sphingomonas sp. MMS12-HWE2-04]|uniref:SURF1 family protein n=1 Tax=Sphingomonas sp. MMS12-HWE2-04 TaxID=3234199 RepID=UPI0038508100
MRPARALLALALLALIAGLVALGVWQLQRRTWKLALIDQVEHRLAAAPVPAPSPEVWPRVGTGDAYLRVTLHGSYLPDRDTLVQAVTDFGSGYWVLTPLRSDRGFIVLVNRGFVPTEMREIEERDAPPKAPVTVAGLLRVSEPHGGFLRANQPNANRWYSRDVAAIASAKKLGPVAPYFIDADAVSSEEWPRGGLTVVRFANNHLVYALTWFAMAAMLGGVLVWLVRRRPRG